MFKYVSFEDKNNDKITHRNHFATGSMIILNLGSNLGNRISFLSQAVNLLSRIITNIRISPIYESDAMLQPDAPASWNMPFLNMVICGNTSLNPEMLLQKIKKIEREVGRKPRKERWSPREIDIDIIAYETLVIKSEKLTIPHYQLADRAFFLMPMMDVVPDWTHPISGKTPIQMLQNIDTSTTRKTEFNLIKTKLVGIINVTPDSFSDGGLYNNPAAYLELAQKLCNDGAAVLDIGAESTRLNAKLLSHQEEWLRLEPVLALIFKANLDTLISIDTRHPETAKRAIAMGANWINDVSGFDNQAMIDAVAGSNVTIVVMHNLGIPANPQKVIPATDNVIKTIFDWAAQKINQLGLNGISKERIIFDPGIGFGKNAEQSWQIINSVDEFKKLGVKLLIGHSRKSFLKSITDKPANQRDEETAAISAKLAKQGIDYLRVHNVAMNYSVIKP